jgi:hypothetical protein
VLVAMLMVLIGVSVSEAGIFRRAYVWQPVCVQPAPYPVATAPAPAAAEATHTVYKPIVPDSAVPAAEPTISTRPAPQYYGPAQSGGWNTAPRSSWDFGRYPPFH